MYQITLSKKQAETISAACELLARINDCQLGEVARAMGFFPNSEEYKALDELGNSIKEKRGPKEHTESSMIAWDIMQVVRHRVAWDTYPEGGMTVQFDTPVKFGPEELITIKNDA